LRDWRNPEFEWDDGNVDHILRYDIYPEEAEEVFYRPYVRRTGDRYTLLGQDRNGRYLTVICEVRSHPTRVRVVTARLMDASERKAYDRQR